MRLSSNFTDNPRMSALFKNHWLILEGYKTFHRPIHKKRHLSKVDFTHYTRLVYPELNIKSENRRQLGTYSPKR